MQDRFRFRAWDLISKEMTVDVQSTYDYGCGGSEGRGLIEQNFQAALDADDYIIMQCTGLEDNKGNLIYEGDILKETCEYDEESVFYDYTVVKHEEKSAGFVMYRPDKPNDITYFDDIDLEKEVFEVVGNIYQNPDFFKNIGVQL